LRRILMLLEIIDQVLHLIWFAALAVVAYHRGMKLSTMMLLASLVVLPREFIDQGDGGLPGIGKVTDIVFCYLGTLVGYLAMHIEMRRPQ
jgi:hypothetical protein